MTNFLAIKVVFIGVTMFGSSLMAVYLAIIENDLVWAGFATILVVYGVVGIWAAIKDFRREVELDAKLEELLDD